MVGDQVLWTDKLTSLPYEAATVCNGHSVATMDTRPSDGVIPLFPYHFLTGDPLPALPGETDLPWRLLQHMMIDLWRPPASSDA